MNAPARKLEIPSDSETYANADLTETMGVFSKYGVELLSPGEIAQQMPDYPTVR